MSVIGAIIDTIGIPAATMIGSQLISGFTGANSQSQAANTQADALGKSTQIQKDMFDKNQANQKPYMDSGGTALNQVMGGLNPGGQFNSSFTPQDFQNNKDPGYEFQRQQGQQAVVNGDTPTQGALSGSTLKDMMSFNQGMASTGYQNAFNRFNTTQNNIFGRLSGIAGLGQNAAAGVGNNGVQAANGMAQSTAAAGAATAGGQIGVGNAISGSISNSMPLGYMMMMNGGGGYKGGGTGGGTGGYPEGGTGGGSFSGGP